MVDIIDTDFLQLSADDRKKVKDAIDEACGLKRIQQDKTEQIKDIIEYISEYGIPKKLARQAINIRFKDNYMETTTEASHLELFYETVFDTNGSSTT